MKTKQELASLMGESNFRKPKIVKCPIIRLNGNKGVFTKMEVGKDGEFGEKKEIGQLVEGTIIAVKCALSEYVPKRYSRWSNEYNGVNDQVTVWEGAEGKKPFILEEGKPKDLKAKYQGLKSSRLLYMIVNKELVRLDIKGSGMSNLFEYFSSFTGEEHLFEYVTRIQPAQELNESLGTTYYKTEFKRGNKLNAEDMEFVANKLTWLHENNRLVKEAYAKNDFVSKIEQTKENLPVVDYEESNVTGQVEIPQEEIDPENLPF